MNDSRLTQLYALAWSAACALFLLLLVEATPLDPWISNWFFDADKGVFTLNDNFLFKQVLHD